MNAYPTSIADVVVLDPSVFEDSRGFFYEAWNQQVFDGVIGTPIDFVQDNHSKSKRGVLRGIHYQIYPHAQGKLVRVAAGRVFDVAVDLRRSSPTFGQWIGEELSAENGRQLWVPAGFGHGFLAQSEWAEVLYKTTDYYAADCDRSLIWNDADLAIDWPLDGEPLLSDKDATAPTLQDAELFP